MNTNIYSLFQMNKAKPVVKQGRKATDFTETAGLPLLKAKPSQGRGLAFFINFDGFVKSQNRLVSGM